MKKALCFLLIICFVPLCACQKADDESTIKSNISGASPPPYDSAVFYTYEEFLTAFTTETPKTDYDLYVVKRNDGEYNQKMLDFLSNPENIYVPYLDGEPMPLHSYEDHWGIDYMTSMEYSLPSIFFDPLPEHRIGYIGLTSLVATGDEELLNISDMMQLVRALYKKMYPNYKFKKVYATVELELADRTVEAVVYPYNDTGTRQMYEFVYDGWLVVVYSTESPVSNAFWKSFSLGPIA